MPGISATDRPLPAPSSRTSTAPAASRRGSRRQARQARSRRHRSRSSRPRRTLTLSAPRAGDYGGTATLTGRLQPSARGARVQVYRGDTYVTSARVAASGRFRARILLRAPGPYHVRLGALRSAGRVIVAPAVAPGRGAGGRSGRRRADAPTDARPLARRLGPRPRLPQRPARAQPARGGSPRTAPGAVRIELTDGAARRLCAGAEDLWSRRSSSPRSAPGPAGRACSRSSAGSRSSTTRSGASTAPTARTPTRLCSRSRR